MSIEEIAEDKENRGTNNSDNNCNSRLRSGDSLDLGLAYRGGGLIACGRNGGLGLLDCKCCARCSSLSAVCSFNYLDRFLGLDTVKGRNKGRKRTYISNQPHSGKQKKGQKRRIARPPRGR